MAAGGYAPDGEAPFCAGHVAGITGLFDIKFIFPLLCFTGTDGDGVGSLHGGKPVCAL
ncbi:hypothetical protein NUITMVR1_24600 [Raoultella ornithinolytica]|nr:hypothetical protein NUITMVR1_24600 [Raoultella ornithinolytica]